MGGREVIASKTDAQMEIKISRQAKAQWRRRINSILYSLPQLSLGGFAIFHLKLYFNWLQIPFAINSGSSADEEKWKRLWHNEKTWATVSYHQQYSHKFSKSFRIKLHWWNIKCERHISSFLLSQKTFASFIKRNLSAVRKDQQKFHPGKIGGKSSEGRVGGRRRQAKSFTTRSKLKTKIVTIKITNNEPNGETYCSTKLLLFLFSRLWWLQSLFSAPPLLV